MSHPRFDGDGNRTDLIHDYQGVVVRNDDPNGLGRVRARVPGIADNPSTGWLRPVSPGAGANRGLWAVPAAGDAVIVRFAQAYPDVGYYWSADWTSPPAEAAGDARVWVLARDGFAIVIDDAAGRLRITNRGTSGHVIELDSDGLSVNLSAVASLTLGSSGRIDVTAPVVTINGRPVAGVGPI